MPLHYKIPISNESMPRSRASERTSKQECRTESVSRKWIHCFCSTQYIRCQVRIRFPIRTHRYDCAEMLRVGVAVPPLDSRNGGDEANVATAAFLSSCNTKYVLHPKGE